MCFLVFIVDKCSLDRNLLYKLQYECAGSGSRHFVDDAKDEMAQWTHNGEWEILYGTWWTSLWEGPCGQSQVVS